MQRHGTMQRLIKRVSKEGQRRDCGHSTTATVSDLRRFTAWFQTSCHVTASKLAARRVYGAAATAGGPLDYGLRTPRLLPGIKMQPLIHAPLREVSEGAAVFAFTFAFDSCTTKASPGNFVVMVMAHGIKSTLNLGALPARVQGDFTAIRACQK